MTRAKAKISGLLAAVAFATAFAQPVPSHAESLRWGNAIDITSVDPHAHYALLNLSVLSNVYEGLVRFDQNFKIEGALATSWERVDDLTWRFKLRPDVKFHNGNPFTADDVVASLLRAADPESPYQPATFWIKDAKKIDDLTVEVFADTPHATVLNDLTGVLIMDKEWMVEHDALGIVNQYKAETSYANTNANGTGPFVLVSRRPDSETVFKANENWWDKASHNITEVVFRPISSDATRVSALMSGELDLITPAPLQDIARLEQSADVKPMIEPSSRILFLNFNVGVPQLNDSNVTGKNPLADVKVRKALHQAINFDLISSRIMRDMTKPTGMFIAPQVQGYAAELDKPSVPHDAAAAKALLAEAGYPDGFEVGFDCPIGNYVNSEQLCQAITAMWSQIGVKAQLTMVPFTNYSSKVRDKKSDIFLMGWANSPQLDAFSFISNFMSSKGNWNVAGYSNPQVDELIEKISREQDMTRRLQLMADAFRVYKEDFGTVPLFAEPLVWGAKKNLDIVQAPDNIIRIRWGNFE